MDVLSQLVYSGLCIWQLMQSTWSLENHLCVTCQRNMPGNETGFEELGGKVIRADPLSLSAKQSIRRLPGCIMDVASDWGCRGGFIFLSVI